MPRGGSNAARWVLVTTDPQGDVALATSVAAAGDAPVTCVAEPRELAASIDDTVLGVVIDFRGYAEPIEVLAATRAAAPGLPIVAIVDEAQASVGLTALRRGADDVLLRTHLDHDSIADALRGARARRNGSIDRDNRRIRELLERSSIGAALVGRDFVTQWTSPSVERILGFKPREIVGEKAAPLIHPDDIHLLRADHETLFNTPGISRTYEYRTRHHDGSWRWVESISTNLLDDASVGAIVVNYRDVTDRKVAELAASEARQRLEFLLSASASVTYTCRPSGDFDVTFISENVVPVLGHEPKCFLDDAHFWMRNIHPDDLSTVQAAVSRILGEGSITLEYRFRHKDGRWRWMHDEVRVVRDARGEALELIGFWFDVTTRRERDEALRRSEANFRLLIEHSPTAVVVHSEGRIVYANPRYANLVGYPRVEELLGRPVLDFVHPDDREMIQRRIEQITSSAHTPTVQSRLVERGGKIVHIEAEALALEFDGRPAIVVLARDLTERREMLARLAVADRMASLGTLAAGVAHEINNPLSYLITNLTLVAQHLPNATGTGGGVGTPRMPAEDLAAMLRDALEGAARVRAVVRDLRAISRTDDESRGPVDVRAVLESSIKMVRNEIRHRARLIEDYENVPAVMGNASRLGQVFLNLLVNAVHAIPDSSDGPKEIHTRIRRLPDARVLVEVQDTGVGIPQENLGRIFDPFFTTKSIGTGTGLGLSICHGIVKSLGGEIAVESEAGRGSVFRVVLPAKRESGADIASVASPVAPNGRRRRVLVVDDEPAIGRALQFLLSTEYDVVPVTRAGAALGRLGGGEVFDAILCDLMMPEMSGVEFHGEVARIAPHAVRRIVFITGGAFTPSARDFLQRIPNRAIEKPFDERVLREALQQVMRD